MSRAILVRELGGPEVLRVEDHDPGAPGEGQLRVRIEATDLAGHRTVDATTVVVDPLSPELTIDPAIANHWFATMAEAVPALTDRTLTVNGVSKAYAMTGWRLGYAGGPADLIDAMGNVQQQSSTHASSITQAAALEALAGPQAVVHERRALFQRRRDRVVDALDAIDGLSCMRPDGTFFAPPGACTGGGKVEKSAAPM